MSNIRLTQNQLQTPDGSELAQICRAIVRGGKLDLNGIKALRKWLRAHQSATGIPAINYLSDLMERITADGFINQKELAELKQALISVLPKTPRTDPPPPPPPKPEPWWTFSWMPTWGWWAFGGWALIAFFMLVLTVVQSKKADRPDAAPEVAEMEPIGGQDTKEDQGAKESTALKERLEKLERQLAEQKKQAKEDAIKGNGEGNIPNNFEQLKDGVVRLFTNTADGRSWTGTGFVVAKDVIVTNHHVAGHSSKAEIVFRDGTTIQADGKLHLDQARDLAILRATGIPPTIKPIPLLNEKPKVLQRVLAMGHPKGFEHTYSSGEITAHRDADTIIRILNLETGDLAGKWLQHNADISTGNSGGPLISMQGKVAGMNTLKHGDAHAQNLNFALASQEIINALDEATAAPLVPFKPHDPDDVFSRFIGKWDVVASGFDGFEPAHLTIEYAATATARGNQIVIDLAPQKWLLLQKDRQPAYGGAEDLVVTSTDSNEIKTLKKQLQGTFTSTEISLKSRQNRDFYKILLGNLEFVWDADSSSLICVSDDETEKYFTFFNEDHWLYVNDRGGFSTILAVKRSGISATKLIPELITRDESAGGQPALENIGDTLKTDILWDTLESQSDIVTRHGTPFSGWARSDFGIHSRFTGNYLLGKFDDGRLVRLIRWHENGLPQFDLSFAGALIGNPDNCYFWTIDLQSSEVPFSEALDGRCTEWHANGKKREQSWFANGKPNRMHHGWHENGEKKYDFSWELGQPHGQFRNYHSNGQLRSEGQHKDGLLMTIEAWLANGDPCSLTKITNGNGLWIERHGDGSIESSVEYRDGEMHGPTAYYYQGGQQQFKLNYKKGILEGDASSWHKNGQKFYQGSYRDGKKDGNWTYWHPNSQKSGEVNFSSGKPVTDWKYWDEGGKRVSSPNQKLAAQQEEAESIRSGARTTIPAEKLKVTVAKQKILFSTKIWYGYAEQISIDLLQQAMEQARQWEKFFIWDEYGVVFSQSPMPMIRLRVQAYESHSDPLHPWTGELLVKGRKFRSDSSNGSFRKNGWSTIKDPPDRWSGYEENYGRFAVRAWFRDGKLYEYQIIEE